MTLVIRRGEKKITGEMTAKDKKRINIKYHAYSYEMVQNINKATNDSNKHSLHVPSFIPMASLPML